MILKTGTEGASLTRQPISATERPRNLRPESFLSLSTGSTRTLAPISRRIGTALYEDKGTSAYQTRAASLPWSAH